jgi:hypothetical protein
MSRSGAGNDATRAGSSARRAAPAPRPRRRAAALILARTSARVAGDGTQARLQYFPSPSRTWNGSIRKGRPQV